MSDRENATNATPATKATSRAILAVALLVPWDQRDRPGLRLRASAITAQVTAAASVTPPTDKPAAPGNAGTASESDVADPTAITSCIVRTASPAPRSARQCLSGPSSVAMRTYPERVDRRSFGHQSQSAAAPVPALLWSDSRRARCVINLASMLELLRLARACRAIRLQAAASAQLTRSLVRRMGPQGVRGFNALRTRLDCHEP